MPTTSDTTDTSDTSNTNVKRLKDSSTQTETDELSIDAGSGQSQTKASSSVNSLYDMYSGLFLSPIAGPIQEPSGEFKSRYFMILIFNLVLISSTVESRYFNLYPYIVLPPSHDYL